MSWFCDAYVEIRDSYDKWYMVKDYLKLVRYANRYLIPWTIDGDPVDVDWLEDIEFKDLSESLQREYSEAPNQYCFKYANADVIQSKCYEIIIDELNKEYAAMRAMGFPCHIDGLQLVVSDKFKNDKHTGPCTFPIDKSIITDLRDAQMKRSYAERFLGVLDTVDIDSSRKDDKRIVFVRSY